MTALVDELTAVIVSDIRAALGSGPLYADEATMDVIKKTLANTAASLMNPPVDVETFLADFDVIIDPIESSVSIIRKSSR